MCCTWVDGEIAGQNKVFFEFYNIDGGWQESNASCRSYVIDIGRLRSTVAGRMRLPDV